MNQRLKDGLRTLLYRTGLFPLLHRLRNRNTLTVFMFHRVLPADSIAYAKAEKEFTFTETGFAACLDFIGRHYHPVSLDDLKASIAGVRQLPARAGLITFDDGWRDTLMYAAPLLEQRRIPALLFLSTEVTELPSDRWWQDALVERAENPETLNTLAHDLGLSVEDNSALLLRRIAVALSLRPDAERQTLLSISATADGRQMLRSDDLPLLSPTITVAGHSHTHAPFVDASFAQRELERSSNKLRELGAHADTMSFPHGVYDLDTLKVAKAAGYALLFSSEAHLVPTNQPFGKDKPLGRIHIPENIWTTQNGKISFPKLASFLFFRPLAANDGERNGI